MIILNPVPQKPYNLLRMVLCIFFSKHKLSSRGYFQEYGPGTKQQSLRAWVCSWDYHEGLQQTPNKTLTQDIVIPSPLATLLFSQNEIRLTQHSLFPVNLYRQGASHHDPVVCKTDRAACGNCIECTEGELPGWQFHRPVSFGKGVQYLAASSPLEIPWLPGALENITHGAEITMAHPLNALKYISWGLVYLSTLIYKNIPCSLPFLALAVGIWKQFILFFFISKLKENKTIISTFPVISTFKVI